jgi:pimeloyl-ACP methyl ester carboxylesterase
MTTLLSVARSGRGEPLLLLHGMGSSRRDFAPVAPELATSFEVVALDLPGSGLSPHLRQRPTVAAITDAVEHTLDAEGLGTVHVLGNSLGARVALELARRGRARSVVAMAPSGMNLPAERAYQGASLGLARVGFRATAPLVEPLSRSALGRVGMLAALKARPWRSPRTRRSVPGTASPTPATTGARWCGRCCWTCRGAWTGSTARSRWSRAPPT